MRYRDLLETLARPYDAPLVRVVGQDFSDTFLHGTARKNVRSLTASERPDSSGKKPSGNQLFNYLFPPEVNEFGTELYLSEPRQPQQAHMFAQGRGNTLAVVRLRHGTRILDLSDEVTRAPQISWGGGAEILRFFHRPAITDDLIQFQLGRIHPGYRERHPDWIARVSASMDPDSPNFQVNTWQSALVPYAQARGFGAIRFADEILLVDRAAIADVRLAKPDERAAAATTRTYPGAKQASLFTDQPTGAHDEFLRATRSEPDRGQ